MFLEKFDILDTFYLGHCAAINAIQELFPCAKGHFAPLFVPPSITQFCQTSLWLQVDNDILNFCVIQYI